LKSYGSSAYAPSKAEVCKNPRIIRLGRIPSHKFLIVNFVDAYEITNGFKTTLERGYLNGDISDVREIASRTDGLITFLFIRRKT
jgi:hypothetical protein